MDKKHSEAAILFAPSMSERGENVQNYCFRVKTSRFYYSASVSIPALYFSVSKLLFSFQDYTFIGTPGYITCFPG